MTHIIVECAEISVLLERATAGLRVRLLRDNIFGTLGLAVREGNDAAQERIVSQLPPEKALDAFHHPFCYLGQDEMAA